MVLSGLTLYISSCLLGGAAKLKTSTRECKNGLPRLGIRNGRMKVSQRRVRQGKLLSIMVAQARVYSSDRLVDLLVWVVVSFLWAWLKKSYTRINSLC